MKKDTEQHNKEYRLCPPYSAGRKSGRPSEGKRIKGSMERGVDKKKKLEQTKKRKKKDEPVSPDDEGCRRRRSMSTLLRSRKRLNPQQRRKNHQRTRCSRSDIRGLLGEPKHPMGRRTRRSSAVLIDFY